MKKTIAILLAAATLFGLASCGPDVPDVPEFSPNVYTDIYTLTSDIFGGDFTVNVNANQAWTASCDKDWVTVTPSSGGASESAVPVTVRVAENFGAVRTATVTITLTESGRTATVSVSQKSEDELGKTIFSEAFANSKGQFTITDKTGSGIWTPYSNAAGTVKCMKATGYLNNANTASESWLISPEIDLSSRRSVYLKFEQAVNYADGKSPKDFLGVSVTTDGTSWTALEVPSFPPGNGWEFLSSGDIDLSSLAGKKIKIAFIYKSTTACAMTWEVRNLVLTSQIEDRGASYKSVPKWLEMPEVKDVASFHVHTADIGNTNVRNFSFVYDEKHLVATWVAYPLCDLYTKKNVSRSDDWVNDPFVKNQAILSKSGDFYTNGYERGHQIPSADRLAAETLNQQTFYFTNLTPQLADKKFNSGIWGDLESHVRTWSFASNGTDTLYVVTGCIVTDNSKTVKDNKDKAVSVPDAYFKALLRYSKSASQPYIAAGFWIDHKDYTSTQTVTKAFMMSIDDLEKKTGIDFFVNLPKETADVVEAANPSDNKFWLN